jgi:hypothetical protein
LKSVASTHIVLLLLTVLQQDVQSSLKLAARCEHPNAVWLTRLFEGRDVKTPKKARKVFLEEEKKENQNLGLRLALASVVEWPWLDDVLMRAAKLGDAYAESKLAVGKGLKEIFFFFFFLSFFPVCCVNDSCIASCFRLLLQH